MTFYRVNNDWCFYIHNYLQSTNEIMSVFNTKSINDEPIMMIDRDVSRKIYYLLIVNFTNHRHYITSIFFTYLSWYCLLFHLFSLFFMVLYCMKKDPSGWKSIRVIHMTPLLSFLIQQSMIFNRCFFATNDSDTLKLFTKLKEYIEAIKRKHILNFFPLSACFWI